LQNDAKSSITVVRKGSYKISPSHELHNNHLYSGSENDIVISRVYQTSFICKFDMGYYPFDVQDCSMKFALQVRVDIFLMCSTWKLALSNIYAIA
jgi:hypothetical protein